MTWRTITLVVRREWKAARKPFLGANEYGTWASPLSLQNENLSNSQALRGDNIAALLLALGLVEPGQSVRFVTQLGQVSSVRESLPDIRRYFDPAAADKAFAEVAAFWALPIAILPPT